jgi:hypothetical protein
MNDPESDYSPTFPQGDREKEDTITIAKNHKTYRVTRLFCNTEKEAISVVVDEFFPTSSPQWIGMDVQDAREVAEAILDLLDPQLVKPPIVDDEKFAFVTDKLSQRNSGQPWTLSEESLLFYLFFETDVSLANLAIFMGRSAFALRKRIRALGVDPGSESGRSAKAATRKKNPTPRELELSSEE